jgi:RNA polymerase-binding transcription factor DksA
MHYHYFTIEQRESLASLMRQRLEGEPLARALERLRASDYGLCARCGADIPFIRLEEDPFAGLCRRCAD